MDKKKRKKSFVEQLFSNPLRKQVAEAAEGSRGEPSMAEHSNFGGRGQELKNKRLKNTKYKKK